MSIKISPESVIATSTARANLFQIIRDVVKTKQSVIVASREGGRVRITACEDLPAVSTPAVKPEAAKPVTAPKPKKPAKKVKAKRTGRRGFINR